MQGICIDAMRMHRCKESGLDAMHRCSAYAFMQCIMHKCKTHAWMQGTCMDAMHMHRCKANT